MKTRIKVVTNTETTWYFPQIKVGPVWAKIPGTYKTTQLEFAKKQIDAFLFGTKVSYIKYP